MIPEPLIWCGFIIIAMTIVAVMWYELRIK